MSKTDSRVNVPKWVKGRGTTVQVEGRRSESKKQSGSRDGGPGRGTVVPNEGTKYPVIK